MRKLRYTGSFLLILLFCWLGDWAIDQMSIAWGVDLPGQQDRKLPIRFTFLTPAQLKQMLDTEQPYTLLDVREPGEFRRGHITGAANIPYHQLHRRATELDHTKPVIIYCIKAGRRSIIAANTLSDQGFTVYNVDGGIVGWEKAFRWTIVEGEG